MMSVLSETLARCLQELQNPGAKKIPLSPPKATSIASVSLYCTEGSSDKEYHMRIVATEAMFGEDRFQVEVRYGRRGKQLIQSKKTSHPVTRLRARQVYEKVRHDKLQKGYREGQLGAIWD
jgi:hypothetical protein